MESFNKRFMELPDGVFESTVVSEINKKKNELSKKGIKIIDFMERPDVPSGAKKAAEAFLFSKENSKYTNSRGLEKLLISITKKLEEENRINIDFESNLLVTSGATEGLSTILQTILEPGDEVLLDDPCFHGFALKVNLARGNCVRVPLLRKNGFKFSIEELSKKITPRTKAFMFSTPDNPTGLVRTREDLKKISELSEKHNFYVIVDEAYERFTYDGTDHVSMLSLDIPHSKVIIVQSASKIFHMHGWRVGWIVACKEIIDRLIVSHTSLVHCPSSFSQAGVAAALDDRLGEGDTPIDELIRLYTEKRDIMTDGLNKIPDVNCFLPQGGYFVFPDFGKYGILSINLCNHLLNESGIASTPGSVFGPSNDYNLRLNFNSPIPEIKIGLERLSNSLLKLRKNKSTGIIYD